MILIPLIAQLAATTAAIDLPDLKLGASRAELTGATCRDARAYDPPGISVEICKRETEHGASTVLLPKGGAPKVIAASYTYPGGYLDALRRSLEQKLGKPSRGDGESLIWMQGVRQVSLRPVCSVDRLCVEVSTDVSARRLARSSGLFVGARPGR